MTTIDKIIELIKTDKKIAENLFLFSEFRKDYSLWTESPRDGYDYSYMKWLFVTDHPNLTLVGVNQLDGSVWCIDDEGAFHQDCDALQNLPYDIIRRDCSYTEHETVQEYFDK